MEKDNQTDDQFISLRDEEGNDTEFEIIMYFENEGTEYAVLYPVDGLTGDEALIFKVTEEGEEAIFENLSDEEFEIAAKIYEELIEKE